MFEYHNPQAILPAYCLIPPSATSAGTRSRMTVVASARSLAVRN